ncbi:MAG: PD40 domain-containing protein [Deferribacteres bacterium]|nr:PD40 domain-containing protein [candidate division KSB1 bacterium]MCB9500613.1 PD40 domain-containing protein [Deferribacteres bacterium]
MNHTLFRLIFPTVALLALACSRENTPTGSNDLYFPRQLTSSGYDYSGYWSPDGDYIAFFSARNTYDPYVAAIQTELWIIKSDGSNEQLLIAGSDLAGAQLAMIPGVVWSSDSRQMLVSIQNHFRNEIWHVALDGSILKDVLPGVSAERPHYAPDGSKVAYLVYETNLPNGSPVYQLIVANHDFTDPQKVITGLVENYSWNSSANELIFSLYDTTGNNFELWKTNMSSGQMKRLTESSNSEIELSCSHDGQLIAYTSDEIVCVTPADSFQGEPVFPNARHPQWIPGTHNLVVTRIQTTDSTSYWTSCVVIDLQGNILGQIVESTPPSVNFSHDGACFVYSKNGNLWIDQWNRLAH